MSETQTGRSGGSVPAQSRGAHDHSDESLGTLVSQLSHQIPDLIRSEIRLAQAEMAQKGKQAGIGIGMFSAAGLLAFFGLGVLITMFVLLLALVLPAWAAALIVAVVLFAAAGAAALVGRKKVAEGTPAKPERAMEGLKEDVATVKGEPPMNPENGGQRRRQRHDRSPEQIEADIAQQREQLADTVDALTAKLDVKAQAGAKVDEVKHRATTDSGKPRPEVVAAGVAALVAVGLAGVVAPR